MANPQISSELDLSKNTHTARIALPAYKGVPSRVVKSYIMSDFSVSGGNEFTNPLASSSIANVGTQINSAIAGIKNAAREFGVPLDGFNPANIQLQNPIQTINVWTNSNRPVFSVQLMFVATTSQNNPITSVNALMNAVYPTRQGAWYAAPLGYNGAGSGTVTLFMGNWFKAPNLVIKSVDFSYSKQIVASKDNPSQTFPLYATGTVTMEPYKMITSTEFRSYFR